MHTHELQSDEFYRDHFVILFEMATSRFNVPPDDAEELAHELLLACICQVKRIENPLTWLTGALRCAVRGRERHA